MSSTPADKDTVYEEVTGNVNVNSRPSDLKITDMRTAKIGNWIIIRIDTNQDIYGLGEIRDGASKTYALMLKSRLLGENPCNVDRLFRRNLRLLARVITRTARSCRWR